MFILSITIAIYVCNQLATLFVPVFETGFVATRRLIRHLLDAPRNRHRCMTRRFITLPQALIKQIERIGRTVIEMAAIVIFAAEIIFVSPVFDSSAKRLGAPNIIAIIPRGGLCIATTIIHRPNILRVIGGQV
jgi:hypothetical protein